MHIERKARGGPAEGSGQPEALKGTHAHDGRWRHTAGHQAAAR